MASKPPDESTSSPQIQNTFVSQESSADVVQEALATGAWGYIVKTDAGRELMTAVNAVLRGEQFVGRDFPALFRRNSERPDPESSRPMTVSLHSSGVRRSTAATRWGSILTMQAFWMASLSSSGAALKVGNAAILSRPSHIGRAFYWGCRPMAWMLVPRSSRRDTSLWTLPKRSRHSW